MKYNSNIIQIDKMLYDQMLYHNSYVVKSQLTQHKYTVSMILFRFRLWITKKNLHNKRLEQLLTNLRQPTHQHEPFKKKMFAAHLIIILAITDSVSIQ